MRNNNHNNKSPDERKNYLHSVYGYSDEKSIFEDNIENYIPEEKNLVKLPNDQEIVISDTLKAHKENEEIKYNNKRKKGFLFYQNKFINFLKEYWMSAIITLLLGVTIYAFFDSKSDIKLMKYSLNDIKDKIQNLTNSIKEKDKVDHEQDLDINTLKVKIDFLDKDILRIIVLKNKKNIIKTLQQLLK